MCETGHLEGMGGSQSFTGNPAANLDSPDYLIERSFRTSDVVARARALGLSMYLGFYLANFENVATPLADWFDDAAWNQTVLPDVRNISAAARLLGFAGVALDQELYPQTGNQYTASWNWDYPGNTHTRSQVSQQARLRGAQFMAALLEGYPQINIVAYLTLFATTWDAYVQQAAKGISNPYESSVQIDFWDGMTSGDGYGNILLLDATFYKGPNASGATWNAALQYQANSMMSYLSQHLANWAYASRRIFDSPFAWIDGDVAHEGAYAAVKSPTFVAQQLSSFSRWAMGGMFGVYAYNALDSFDYGPFSPAMKAATRAATQSNEATSSSSCRATRSRHWPIMRPLIRGNPGRSGHRICEGPVGDPCRVLVKPSLGGDGAATMTWQKGPGNDVSGWNWRMAWSTSVPLGPGPNRIQVTAVSIDGRSTTKWIVVAG